MYIPFLYLEVPSIVLELLWLKLLLHLGGSLKVNTFSKDNGNNVNVNTESNFDHIYSGIVSILHFHDNHTPLLNTVPWEVQHPVGRWKWCMAKFSVYR